VVGFVFVGGGGGGRPPPPTGCSPAICFRSEAEKTNVSGAHFFSR